jgi:hypothetical protein
MLGTHGRPARGRLELTVFSSAGRLLRTADVELATARDNDWLRFEFAPIADATGCPFLLRFSLADAGPRTTLSLYDTAVAGTRLPHRALRRLGLLRARDSLYCRLRYA